MGKGAVPLSQTLTHEGEGVPPSPSNSPTMGRGRFPPPFPNPSLSPKSRRELDKLCFHLSENIQGGGRRTGTVAPFVWEAFAQYE